MNRIYFDNAATTPIHSAVIETMTNVMRDTYGNPSSIHAAGRTARAVIEEARKNIATHLNASIGEIFFTSGGTESNNMSLKCAVRDLGVQRIISSPTEHHCNLHSLEVLEQQGTEIVYLNVDQRGRIDYQQLEELVTDNSKKTLVSLMHANNELGTKLDFKRVSELCKANNTLFHSDTVQTIGHFPIDVEENYVSFLSGSAHKFHGPKGVGFIYINANNIIKPYLDGGAQERNMRGGTENIYGIAGMAKALDMACENMTAHQQHVEEVRQYLIEQLQENFVDIQFNGDWDGDYLYTVLNVSFPPSPRAALLLLNLDIAGICASGGSACSSGVDVGSHVIAAIKGDPTRKMIRFSFSYQNTKQEIDTLIEKLKTMVEVKTAVNV